MKYTDGNSDNITKAVEGLDRFTKNWCMDCKKTEELQEPTFRCGECEFAEGGYCQLKIFVNGHESDFDLSKFGSMTR